MIQSIFDSSILTLVKKKKKQTPDSVFETKYPREMLTSYKMDV